MNYTININPTRQELFEHLSNLAELRKSYLTHITHELIKVYQIGSDPTVKVLTISVGPRREKKNFIPGGAAQHIRQNRFNG